LRGGLVRLDLWLNLGLNLGRLRTPRIGIASEEKSQAYNYSDYQYKPNEYLAR
jgi:hypothetical protein